MNIGRNFYTESSRLDKEWRLEKELKIPEEVAAFAHYEDGDEGKVEERHESRLPRDSNTSRGDIRNEAMFSPRSQSTSVTEATTSIATTMASLASSASLSVPPHLSPYNRKKSTFTPPPRTNSTGRSPAWRGYVPKGVSLGTWLRAYNEADDEILIEQGNWEFMAKLAKADGRTRARALGKLIAQGLLPANFVNEDPRVLKRGTRTHLAEKSIG
ncbi:hypothetical protein B0J14DRAFT_644846 [Halenospora varia]|nr:hypothetical protein B0J14DRAFT_644846 [Halenospora varia]